MVLLGAFSYSSFFINSIPPNPKSEIRIVVAQLFLGCHQSTNFTSCLRTYVPFSSVPSSLDIVVKKEEGFKGGVDWFPADYCEGALKSLPLSRSLPSRSLDQRNHHLITAFLLVEKPLSSL